jgi:hypothetical protein
LTSIYRVNWRQFTSIDVNFFLCKFFFFFFFNHFLLLFTFF